MSLLGGLLAGSQRPDRDRSGARVQFGALLACNRGSRKGKGVRDQEANLSSHRTITMHAVFQRLFLACLLLLAGSAYAEQAWHVQFKLTPSANTGFGNGRSEWLATYDSPNGPARFVISLEGSFGAAIGSGTSGFIQSVPGSQRREFLEQLARALHAKGGIPSSKRVNRLVFDVAILGRQQTRIAPEAGFTSKPPGNWIATKLFLANGAGEVYLNLNPKDGIGDFSMKDEEYADVVLRELASVL